MAGSIHCEMGGSTNGLAPLVLVGASINPCYREVVVELLSSFLYDPSISNTALRSKSMDLVIEVVGGLSRLLTAHRIKSLEPPFYIEMDLIGAGEVDRYGDISVLRAVRSMVHRMRGEIDSGPIILSTSKGLGEVIIPWVVYVPGAPTRYPSSLLAWVYSRIIRWDYTYRFNDEWDLDIGLDGSIDEETLAVLYGMRVLPPYLLRSRVVPLLINYMDRLNLIDVPEWMGV